MEVIVMSKKMLVAYFSASGVTAKAAWKLSEATGLGAILLKGKMLNGVVAQAELKAWVESL